MRHCSQVGFGNLVHELLTWKQLDRYHEAKHVLEVDLANKNPPCQHFVFRKSKFFVNLVTSCARAFPMTKYPLPETLFAFLVKLFYSHFRLRVKLSETSFLLIIIHRSKGYPRIKVTETIHISPPHYQTSIR